MATLKNTLINGKLAVTEKVKSPSFEGSGASLTSLNASNLSSGTVPTERLPAISKSVSVSVATSAWAADTTYTGYAYKASVTVSGVTASNNIIVGLNATATTAQEEACATAGIQCKGQAAGIIYLYAKTKPTTSLTFTTVILG